MGHRDGWDGRILYGTPPVPKRSLFVGYCAACDNGKKLSGEKGGCSLCGRVAEGEKLVDELEKLVDLSGPCPVCQNGAALNEAVPSCSRCGRRVVQLEPKIIDAPPSYALSSELEVIALLEQLPDNVRARVLRYALSRWALQGEDLAR